MTWRMTQAVTNETKKFNIFGDWIYPTEDIITATLWWFFYGILPASDNAADNLVYAKEHCYGDSRR